MAINFNVTSDDLPALIRIGKLRELMTKIAHLAEHRSDKVICEGKIWCYADLVYLAYEYYVLARNYGLTVHNFVKWLEQEQAILKQHHLAWPA
ncbi:MULTISPECIES: hypothetical protein [unclassified Arsukibacterium]|uniref:hypothetical protein n=1 Tax=unclassified Arsukibacterium TaxID=2635278 RepID=UPI000C392BEF|nr:MULTISPECIES: hypothetical protein [unclassified Arsukibacterium]MAA92915.1 hypothetical protein [Rheinheimera sp.]MBM34980.1 hypothetical protein [Rheinheimera sp.]HAW93268.1 hypothetical protein [Candidatus Azambacteria bacterium]|tara:strand:- start:476 stop:754 length:279 start_codon:yes stop_codon:yes gene_type:complete